jgi:hypothetical protein
LSASAIAAASRRLKFKTDIRRRECKAMHLACNAIIYLLPARVQKHKPQCKNLPLAARTSSPANKSNTQINKRIVYTVRAYPIHTQGIKYVYSVDKMMCSRRISLQGEDAVAKAGQRSALTSTFDTFTRSPSKLIVQLRLNANCGHQLPPREESELFYVLRRACML